MSDGSGRTARTPRLHVEEPLVEGAELTLARESGRRLSDVLRVREGTTLRVFDGTGPEHEARVLEAGKRVRLTVGPARPAAAESPFAITLLQAVSRGDRMDATVRQATELGATAIRPVMTRRGAVRLDAARAAKRHAHWQAILVSACEQCGRTRVPALHPVAALDEALDEVPGEMPSATSRLALQLDPSAPHGLGAALDRAVAAVGPPRSIAILIGPESGLDPDEIAAASAAGFEPVRCGPRTLRTETAGPAVIAVLQARFGDLDS